MGSIVVSWEYMLTNSVDGKEPGWYAYEASASATLESAYQERSGGAKRTTWHLHSGDFRYEVNLEAMTQRNLNSGTTRKIRRVEEAAPSPKKPKLEQPKAPTKFAPPFASPFASPPPPPPKKKKVDPQFEALFAGIPEWEAALTPYLDATYVGAGRSSTILPARELTFQALKALDADEWRVVILGQNPYPKKEKATGIAMFDPTVTTWASPNFGKCMSMRMIVKNAAMSKYSIPKDTNLATLRSRLGQWGTCTPAQWFQAMLSQGVLLLNASLTTEEGASPATQAQHLRAWNAVIGKIVETILRAKAASRDDAKKRLLFLWWGNDAKKIRASLESILAPFSSSTVAVSHLEHCNPAAYGDAFCNKEAPDAHFVRVNAALKDDPVDWLPTTEWVSANARPEHGAFVTKTKELHRLYLSRLQDGLFGDGGTAAVSLAPIFGISKLTPVTLREACAPIGLAAQADSAVSAVRVKTTSPHVDFSDEDKAAVYLYTGNSLYRNLNAALRDPNRLRVDAYRPYLKRFFDAFAKLQSAETSTRVLYRGVGVDLTKLYAEGAIVTWWAVSSCTPNYGVAAGFAKDTGTVFVVTAKTAVPVMDLSAYGSEQEFILAPGTQLGVTSVTNRGNGANHNTVCLEELHDVPRLVS